MKKTKRIQTGCLLLCLFMTDLCQMRTAVQAVSQTVSYAADMRQLSSPKEQPAGYEYTIETEKKEYTDDSGRVRGIVSFSYPRFSGTSDAVLKINRQIKKKCHKFMTSGDAKSIQEFTEDSIANGRFHEDTEQYFLITYCDVSYQKNGIVSFYMSEHWYAGGVHNRSDYGLNYNLDTGKRLTVNDVIPGNAKKKILKAAEKYCGSDTGAYEIIKKTKKYKFYLENGNVHICYGSYELGHGTSIDEFTVKGSVLQHI